MRNHISRTLILAAASLQIGGWGLAQSKSPPAITKDDYGTLVIFARWDDTRHTPVTDVYVEAYGFVSSLGSNKSYVLRLTAPGRYEAKIPPAVYDVFVSEGGSIPVCKRIGLTSHGTVFWKIRLKTDLYFTQR
jgi:hypothetical protein